MTFGNAFLVLCGLNFTLVKSLLKVVKVVQNIVHNPLEEV